MIEIRYKKKGIKIAQIWFADFGEARQRADIRFYHGVQNPADGKNCMSKSFHSLMSDLTLSEEEISAKINKNVRYEIRRNRKEDMEVRIFNAKDLLSDTEVLSKFAQMYEKMYESKGMKGKINRTQVMAYLQEDAFCLTAVYRDEEPLVFHSYIVGADEVRLLHSASDFRSGGEDANLIARANKRLHYEDMLHFAGVRKRRMDWGGVSSLDNPNGIDAFKYKFGGEPVTYYNVYEGISLLGKAAVKMLKKRR